MIIPIVLVVVLLILILLLRALTAPLILMGTVVLSFGAALGISTLLFEYVFGFAGSDPGFPLFAFVFLVALGHRLQHLPDDPGPRGDGGARHPAGSLIALSLDRRRDHLGRAGAGGDVPGARLAPVGVPGRARDRGRARASCSTR